MTTGHVFIATSLDGFIARPNGGLDWLEAVNSAGEEHGYQAFIETIDGIFMGRETFQVSLGFEPWPYDKPLIVLSTRLAANDLPSHLRDRVSIAGSVSEALTESERRGWRRAYVDGGATIRAFLRAGIIKDMVISRIPVLLGEGLPLFGPVDADIPLKHLETRAFPSGLVQSRYAVEHPQAPRR
jgi:dihydrofolate reductase